MNKMLTCKSAFNSPVYFHSFPPDLGDTLGDDYPVSLLVTHDRIDGVEESHHVAAVNLQLWPLAGDVTGTAIREMSKLIFTNIVNAFTQHSKTAFHF